MFIVGFIVGFIFKELCSILIEKFILKGGVK